ncbi:hypothetical protein [Mangrovimonas cancribranchiae]|uniref:Uncharacterized protein n=1 Tax=Mangrovimonas cancribranchiae TaxID=3080055 RepID=A0AAU6NZH2_9FLAO
MKYNKTYLLLFILCFFSCKEAKETYTEKVISQKFAERMWIESSDSLNGVTFLKNQIAFFNNMKFTSDSIYDYSVIQRIKYKNGNKTEEGIYLKRTQLYDTIYNELVKYNDTSFVIKRNNRIETFIME